MAGVLPNRRIEVGDVALEAVELGEGPPLLFLHGEDGLLWSEPALQALAEHFKVLAPHHPGWGGSTRPEYITDVRDLAAVYSEYLEVHAELAPVVVGCSLGGWLAAEITLTSHVSPAALVLVAPTGVKLGTREDRDYADIYMASIDELQEILYGDADRAPDRRELPDEDYFYLAVAQEATARYGWKPYMHDPRLRHWLRRVNVPTLLVAGAADRFALLPDFYSRYAALVGPEGSRLELLEGVGHRVEEEAPTELASLIIDHAVADAAATSNAV